MKGAPPLVELLFNLCPLCVFAMPIITVVVMIKLMAKPRDPVVDSNVIEDAVESGD
jgi:hypothetical protein